MMTKRKYSPGRKVQQTFPIVQQHVLTWNSKKTPTWIQAADNNNPAYVIITYAQR
jgi:hypothetical protein